MREKVEISIGVATLRPGTTIDPSTLLAKLRDIKGDAEILQVFDARSVAGPSHVKSAYLHAMRALGGPRRIRLRDKGAIMALYMAGTDQIERALARVGISSDTTKVVIVRSPAGELSKIAQSLDLVPEDDGLGMFANKETLKRLGIEVVGQRVLTTREMELEVLEHVAMVDIPG